MATSVQIPVDVYLHTSYRPDREYVDGEVRERNVGKWEHARLQWLLAWWFGSHESEWGCIGSTEQRVAVSKTRIRIPDLVILKAGHPPDVLVEPPLLVIEILSPDDTYSDTQERAADYRGMGVQTIWIIDPRTRTARVCVEDTWSAASRLEVPGTAIYVDLSRLFERLDESKPKT
jgi:Uma2 family endonuclease